MQAKSVTFGAISTRLKNYLSKKKACQSIFFFLEEPLKVSAKCNLFKHFSVFTLFSLSKQSAVIISEDKCVHQTGAEMK